MVSSMVFERDIKIFTSFVLSLIIRLICLKDIRAYNSLFTLFRMIFFCLIISWFFFYNLEMGEYMCRVGKFAEMTC